MYDEDDRKVRGEVLAPGGTVVDDTIKSFGNYSAIVDFGDDISAKVKLKVVAE